MPTYISLIHYTDEGARKVKEGPKRLDEAKKAFKAAGGELKQWYRVMGRYDAVVISEFPNDEVAMKVAVVIESLGALRTEGSRAFTEDEYRKIIASLP